jgi:arylsulfatase A-like enzyme
MPRNADAGRGRSAEESSCADLPHALTSRIGRRDFLLALAAAAASGCVSLGGTRSDATATQRKPNIVLILLDDLGYADLGCQGVSQDIRTPHIDSLARGGIIFSSGYVMAPVCSPSRAALLTGRYQQRFGHEHNTGDLAREIKDDIGLPTSEITLADILKAEGYATGIIGKWHLGANDKYHPLNRGFDEFFGHLGGAHWYTVWDDPNWGPIYRGMASAVGDEYLTDAFSREAVAFVQRHRNEPFFLYLSYNAVHAPMQAPQKYLDRFPHIADQDRRTLAAMLSAADDGVGQLLRALQQTGLEQDTLIFCISDNGASPNSNSSRNDPLRATKGSLYEGGIRVPFILRWPARVPAELVYHDPACTLDILPTALAAAGGTPPKGRIFDGVNLIPYLTEEKRTQPHGTLFWRWGENFALRKDNWKLVKSHQPAPRLYDLSKDISEADDLYEQEPRIVKKLMAEYSRWEEQMVEPLWTVPRPGQELPRRNKR